MASHQVVHRATAHVRERKAPTTKAAPLTTEEKKDKATHREKKQAEIDAEVDAWFSYTMAKVDELSARFNKKPRYFHDMFFHGGAHLVRERKTNPWNAFMSKKADEVNGGKSSFFVPTSGNFACSSLSR